MKKNGCEHVNGRITADQLGLRWISEITRWSTANAVHAKPHRHPHIELLFCLRGELSYRINGYGSVEFCEGSGIVIPRRTMHLLGEGTDAPCERIGLHVDAGTNRQPQHSVFSPADIRFFCQVLSKMAGQPFRLDSGLLASVRELAGFLRRAEPPSPAELGFIRCLCCGILFRTATLLQKPLIAPRSKTMDAAVAFIHRHYAEKIDIPKLANQVGYGRTRLFLLFKRHTGLTPNEYLVRLRIRKAGELVDAGERDAARVAKAVGFNDVVYFKAVYLRYTGTAFPSTS